jgi:hypothetical protein
MNKITTDHRNRFWCEQLIRPAVSPSLAFAGSTVPYVVDRILQQGEERNRDRVFLPTGFQSQELITHAGLRLGDITQYSVLDVTIDGADE